MFIVSMPKNAAYSYSFCFVNEGAHAMSRFFLGGGGVNTKYQARNVFSFLVFCRVYRRKEFVFLFLSHFPRRHKHKPYLQVCIKTIEKEGQYKGGWRKKSMAIDCLYVRV